MYELEDYFLGPGSVTVFVMLLTRSLLTAEVFAVLQPARFSNTGSVLATRALAMLILELAIAPTVEILGATLKIRSGSVRSLSICIAYAVLEVLAARIESDAFWRGRALSD